MQARLRAGHEPRGLLRVSLLLFLLICVFDPADLLLGLKVQIFLMCWLVAIIDVVRFRDSSTVHEGIVIYVLLFLIVPLASIGWYVYWNGEEPFMGFQLMKAYLLISLALLLYLRRINLMRALVNVLFVLALAIIGLAIILAVFPELMTPLYLLGGRTGIFILDERDYGGGLVMRQVYFVTSPMLAIAVAWLYQSMRAAENGFRRFAEGARLGLCVVAMFLAGTRNNMAAAVLLPVSLFLLTSRRIVEAALIGGMGLLALIWIFSDELFLLLSPNEVSNSMKLMLVQDYGRILSDPVTFFLGRGLGAFDYWNTRAAYGFVSELTYFELIRNFGIFGAGVMFLLLVFPLLYVLFYRPSYPDREHLVGYGFYLIMCASNPNLFSSMGILILSVIVANIYLYESNQAAVQLRSAA
jgi:hypothetical protein